MTINPELLRSISPLDTTDIAELSQNEGIGSILCKHLTTNVARYCIQDFQKGKYPLIQGNIDNQKLLFVFILGFLEGLKYMEITNKERIQQTQVVLYQQAELILQACLNLFEIKSAWYKIEKSLKNDN